MIEDKLLEVSLPIRNVILRECGKDIIILIPDKKGERVYISKVYNVEMWSFDNIQKIEKVLNSVYTTIEKGDTWSQTFTCFIEQLATISSKEMGWDSNLISEMVFSTGLFSTIRKFLVMIHDVIIEDDFLVDFTSL